MYSHDTCKQHYNNNSLMLSGILFIEFRENTNPTILILLSGGLHWTEKRDKS
jgi:hypothetical protein